MNRIYFELYSKSREATIYTIRFEGCLSTETDLFVDEYLEKGFSEDILAIKRWLINIENRGAQLRYFRAENNVFAGPVSFSRLRIYCIRCSHNIVVIDGGGEKKGQKTQDGAETWKAMKLMMAIDEKLIVKIQENEIRYSNDLMTLEGELFIDLKL
ncbi:hypothetical protein SAMN05216327_102590 [Dyadobacter sp. SG02]|uniref:hypothetical protein n=1 Tax=Dyadobacter sp. SG02 TaxID=1855291 RepID=UPI0008BDEF02|nr:hypothetical protein [Dyadobacter sp. SG02]SEI58436.1 hypothetical protein SAMN05216327_102590 [Dyadobacter sp. SG02]